MSSSTDGLTVLNRAVREVNSQGKSRCLRDALAALSVASLAQALPPLSLTLLTLSSPLLSLLKFHCPPVLWWAGS